MFHRFVTASDMKVSTPIVDGTVVPDIRSGVTFGIADIGDWVFVALQRLPLIEQSCNDGAIIMKFGPPILLEGYAFEASNDNVVERFKADYQRHAAVPGSLALDNALLALQRTEHRRSGAERNDRR